MYQYSNTNNTAIEILGLLIGVAAVVGLTILVADILNEIFGSLGGRGRLLARRERVLVERAELYERGAEIWREEVERFEILDPKGFMERYGKGVERNALYRC